jgi:hypothetical protein
MLRIKFYVKLRQMKPSEICVRVAKCNVMIMSVWKATRRYTFKTTDAAFKNNIKNSDVITETKPVKLEDL